MKVSVARSGRDIGEFELEEVRAGLRSGLYLSSDFGWYPGLTEWEPLLAVVKGLDQLLQVPPPKPKPVVRNAKWRKKPATPRQIRFLKGRKIAFPAGATCGQACDIIGAQPESIRQLMIREIEALKKAGFNPAKMSWVECKLRLQRMGAPCQTQRLNADMDNAPDIQFD